ncbi:MAG: GNAT family N-acetyltransferase [Rhodospirillales bacterium]|nr:GNAT family N-acetyltransferase [Rhodospirillales bacterium]MDH3791450.1 GNAT family N-acetyltransferase [Rhodospirillales bacterium]MDH3910814.1 GNAT family N-acetyltransferase [Rhodospirillales bacterium]MDH3919366.1 GNAT family N-acetyltransferase [Rhodospirillales bacterium]MDH3967924.1 GNAT family N-acetyltransferase [Rhodospirillales bacterium]
MPNDLRLRPVRPEDAGALTALAIRSKRSNGYDDAFMAACRAELTFVPNAPGQHAWLVEDGRGRILGLFDLRLEDGITEVYAMFVAPDARRSGIGRLLWTKLEQVAAGLGATAIGVDSDPEAEPFYLAMGAAIVGEAPSGSIPGRLLPRLVKRLA